MTKSLLPFTEQQISDIAKEYGTPFYIYDEAGIRKTSKDLMSAYSWVDDFSGEGYKNYFAVKALPNPHILEVLAQEGMGADASSGPELALAKAAGMTGNIVFTSNNTAPKEYRDAYALGAVINLDDINQIDVLHDALGGKFPDTISFRYNPGKLKDSGVNELIGSPEEAKFGVPDSQLEQAYTRARSLGATRFGLHTMVATNELDAEHHVKTARLAFNKAVELNKNLGLEFSFINLGGGLGIPYLPDQSPLDYLALSDGTKQAYQEIILANGLKNVQVVTENGRHVTGPHGYFVSTVRSIKETYHRFVGLDSSMADLMRPGMYDSYHELYVIGKAEDDKIMQRVVGSLCENNDHFTGNKTKERMLPKMVVGDIVVMLDAGAHAHTMGFNYNGKTRPAEVLLHEDGTTQLIRRAETQDDLFATLDYPGLN